MTDRSTHLDATAASYDALAAQYTEFVHQYHETDAPGLDRAVLAAFADLTGPGPVADLGCGSGRVTAHLRSLGMDTFGVDLSPALIDHARERYPKLRFEIGSMDALDLPDGELAGIVSWYSIIHAPPALISTYSAEFRRVLAPGGHLLLAFFESRDEPVSTFDHAVTTAYHWPIDDLAGRVRDAGFTEVGRVLREPCDGERPLRRATLLMRAAGTR